MTTQRLSLTGPNNWNLLYLQQHQGNPDNWKKLRLPIVGPIEIPFLLDSHVLAVSVTSSASKPTWKSAGTLVQTYIGVVLGDGPSAGVDAHKERIALNTTALVNLPKLADDFYLWFDPVPWLPSFALGIWEFVGDERDTTQDLLDTLKVDLLRVETKVDSLRT